MSSNQGQNKRKNPALSVKPQGGVFSSILLFITGDRFGFSSLTDSFTEKIFNLAVDRSEIIGGPGGDLLV